MQRPTERKMGDSPLMVVRSAGQYLAHPRTQPTCLLLTASHLSLPIFPNFATRVKVGASRPCHAVKLCGSQDAVAIVRKSPSTANFQRLHDLVPTLPADCLAAFSAEVGSPVPTGLLHSLYAQTM